MRVIPIKQDGLAHLSYFVVSGQEAIVIDPRRDADVYLSLANMTGSKITWVLETHRNEDYVIGSLEIQNRSPTTSIGHSNRTNFGYGDGLTHGEQITVGRMKITCLNTPGHTDDSICYLIADMTVADDPLLCFTGDTLFVGNVGRTDLVNSKITEKMAKKLYESLHEVLMPLEDSVIIYPGHGAGSVCGGEMLARDFSTIGYERRHNKWLHLDEDTFIREQVTQNLSVASYFKHCERLNTVGPPLLDAATLPVPLTESEFDIQRNKPDTVVIDTRSPEAFANCHIPNSINIPMSKLGLVVGWVVRPDETVLLVLDRQEDINDAFRYHIRVGFDRVIGYLGGSFTDWVSEGLPTASLVTVKSSDIYRLVEKGDVTLLDVREGFEVKKQPVDEAIHIPLTHIRESKRFPSNGQFITICETGMRAMIAGSILRMRGVDNIQIAQGGIKALERKGVKES